MPLILSGNVASATADADVVTNSCRINGSNDSDELKLTFAGDGNRRTFTCSFWLKRVILGANQSVFFGDTDGSSNADQDSFYFNSSDAFLFGGWDSNFFTTTRVFRDVGAWYHFVIAVDTTQSIASNRIKLYVNGTAQSYTSGSGYPDEDDDLGITKSGNHSWFGNDGQSGRGDGYLAEAVLIDGLQLAPTSFGEFNEDSPTIWQPIDVSGLTFGTNGFYLDFEASANLGNDANGGTDWTEVNLAAVDQATDTPTNNFCTLNPLDGGLSGTFSEGNLKLATASSGYATTRASFGLTNGKWYWEGKAAVGTAFEIGILVSNVDIMDTDDPMGKTANGYAYTGGGNKYTNDTNSAYGDTYAADDIIGVALNLDDGELFFYKNGVIQNSGTAAFTSLASDIYHPAVSDDSGGSACTWELNFGGCSAFTVSSGNSDANGYGNFEYAVPSGYYALCTKNLAEYG